MCFPKEKIGFNIIKTTQNITKEIQKDSIQNWNIWGYKSVLSCGIFKILYLLVLDLIFLLKNIC